MKKMRPELVLLPLLLLSSPSFADDSAYPDEIDHPTYEKIFRDAKAISNQLRATSDDKWATVVRIERLLNNTLSSIANAEQSIQTANSNINFWTNDNANREARLQVLADIYQQLLAEISELETIEAELFNDIQNREANLVPERSRLADLDREYSRERSLYLQSQDRLAGLRAEIQDRRSKIADIEQRQAARGADLAAQQDKLQKQLQRRDNLRGRRANLQNEIQGLEGRLSNVQGRLQQVENEMAPLRQERQRLNGRLDNIKNEISGLNTKISNTKAKIQDLRSKKQNAESQLEAVKAELQDLRGQKQALPGQISGLESELSGIETELAATNTDLADKEAKFTQVSENLKATNQELRQLQREPQTPERDAKIAKLKDKKQKQSERKKNLRGKVQDLKKKVTRLGNQKNQKTKALNQAKTKLANIDKKIQRKRAEKQNKEQAIANFTTRIQNNRQKLPALEQKLTQAQGRRQNVKGKLDQVANQLQALRPKKQRLEERLANISQNLSNQRATLADVRNKLQNLRQRIPETEAAIADLNQRLNRLANRLQRNRNELRSFRQEARQEEDNLNFRAGRLSRAEQRLNEQSQLVASLEADLAQVVSAREANLGVLNARLQDKVENENETRVHVDTIDSQTIAIAEAEEAIAQNQLFIAEETAKLPGIRTNLADAREEFRVADAAATTAEADTAAKKSDWQERKSRYLQFLAEAKNLGTAQGSAHAATVGEVDGRAFAGKRGLEVGEQIGSARAALDGKFRGLILGKLAGNQEGYYDGETSETDYQSGYDAGYEIGLQKSKAEAMRIKFPEGYRFERTRLLKKLPPTDLKDFEVEEIVGEGSGSGVDKDELDSDYRGRTDITSEDLREAARISSAIDSTVLETKGRLNRYDRPEVNLSLPQFVYEAPTSVNVDTEGRDCSQVYKEVADYIAACEAEYARAYPGDYLSEHQETFYNEYNEAYSMSYDVTFEAKKNETFKAGFDESFPVVYSEAKERGASVARARGLEDGKVAGYDENIVEQRDIAFKKGQKKVQKFFKNNAVVRLPKNARGEVRALDSRGMLQGSAFNLATTLENLGGIASKITDARVRIVALTNNVTINGQAASLNGIPAKSLKDFPQMAVGRVRDNAVPGEAIRLKAVFSYRGDDVDASFSEELNFNSKVIVNPEIQSGYDFDAEPKWRKWRVFPFKWDFRKHDISVNLTGLRNNVPGAYQVRAEIVEGSKYIKLLTATANVSAPSRGQTASGTIRYQFKKKKAEDKNLAIKITVSYEGTVVGERVLRMKSK